MKVNFRGIDFSKSDNKVMLPPKPGFYFRKYEDHSGKINWYFTLFSYSKNKKEIYMCQYVQIPPNNIINGFQNQYIYIYSEDNGVSYYEAINIFDILSNL
jgi:hypothetical protein